MSKIHSAIFYFVINLILPGLAQLTLGFYIRGAIQLLAGIACCSMSTGKLLAPMIKNIQIMMESGNGALEMPDLKSIIIYTSCFILIWSWSLIEIPFLLRKKRASVTPPPLEKTL